MKLVLRLQSPSDEVKNFQITQIIVGIFLETGPTGIMEASNSGVDLKHLAYLYGKNIFFPLSYAIF